MFWPVMMNNDDDDRFSLSPSLSGPLSRRTEEALIDEVSNGYSHITL